MTLRQISQQLNLRTPVVVAAVVAMDVRHHPRWLLSSAERLLGLKTML
jgi:hypothetical protein